MKMKLVTIIDDNDVAKLLSDPMRRAILNILREKPMTEAGLAQRLELTDATVNYHLAILKRIKLVTIVKREPEEHGIIQKFYLPSSYLYLADIEHLEPEAARYYLPLNIERIRGALSAFQTTSFGPSQKEALSGGEVDALGEEFARILVRVAKQYEGEVVEAGTGESIVTRIYSEAVGRLFHVKRTKPK